VEESVQAAQWGAHGLIAGHIFATDCKKGVPPRGLDFLQQVCNAVTLPVYAIGGISVKTYPLVQQSNAAGVCVMSQAMEQENFFWKTS
jgi:thiamine-phosphate pyrophosphorylase